MSQQDARLPPRGHVPQPDVSILAGRCQERAVRRKRDRSDFLRVPPECVQTAVLTQPPEVAPLETAQVFLVALGPLSVQKLPRSGEVARLPELVRHVQIRGIEQAARLFLAPGSPLRLGVGALLLGLGISLGPNCQGFGPMGKDGLPGADGDAHDQRRRDGGRSREGQLVPQPRFLEPVGCARRPSDHRLIRQVPLMSAARPLAVSYRRVRSFSSAFSTIQSRSPRSSFDSFAGSVLRLAATLGRGLRGAQPAARASALPARGRASASRRGRPSSPSRG